MLIMVIFAYLIGSITFGPMVARRKGVDLNKVGSGNIGATNTFRALGWKAGVLVLLLDVSKGILPVYIGYLLGFHGWQTVAIGTAAILGHLYPVFFHFKGGKGVATATGVFLVLNFTSLLIAIGIFALSVKFTRYVSLGSILGAMTVCFVQLISKSPWLGDNLPVTILSLLLLLIVIYTHRKNIPRLLAGTENKIVFKKIL